MAGILVLSSMLACGISGQVQQAAAKAKLSADLMQVGIAYHQFNSTNNRGPKDVNELANMPGLDPSAKAAINMAGPGGSFVVHWGLKISTDFPDGTSNTVLGYESKVPSTGGMVLMGDGGVRHMTPTEFSAAKKPKGK
jgi:hypothetical protein